MKKFLVFQFMLLSTITVFAQDDPYSGYGEVLQMIQDSGKGVIIYHIPHGNTGDGIMTCLTSGKIQRIFTTGVLIETQGKNVKFTEKGTIYEGGGPQAYYEYINFDKIVKLKVVKESGILNKME